MTRARPFPLDEAAEESRRTDRGARSPIAERAWPVLARIGELHRGKTQPAPSKPRPASAASPRTYRVDAPHRGDIRAAAPPSDKHVATLPGVLRVAVQAWRLFDPYRPLVRAAAMFALMAIAGMSMTLMLGPQEQPEGAPPARASAAAQPTEPTAAGPHPALATPTIEPIPMPEPPTTSAKPTAVGPANVTAPEAKTPDVAADEAAVEQRPPEPIAAAYPTTPYAEPSLPQVRTSDPPLGVARLQGEIREVPIR